MGPLCFPATMVEEGGGFSEPSNTAIARKMGRLEVVAIFSPTVGTQTLEQMHKPSDMHGRQNKTWVYSDCIFSIWGGEAVSLALGTCAGC